MSHQNPIQAMLQQGLLPYLFGKMGLKQDAGAAPPQAAPPQPSPTPTPTQQPAIPSGQGQPQSQPPGAGAGAQPSKPVFDTSGAAGGFPAPTPQPISQINSLQELLMQWNQRKDAKKQAEASNIAQKLMKAIQDKDVGMVHEIINDKHATGILDKVYKGWLTKAKEAQKPGEPADPVTQGFEQGLQDFISGKSKQQPEMPKTMGGYYLPQASPQQQIDAGKTAAALRQLQGDPNLARPTQLTSEEVRRGELGAGPEKAEAEKAKANAEIIKAQNEAITAKERVDEARYKAQQAQTALTREQLHQQSQGKTDQAKLDTLSAQTRKAQLQVDLENVRLEREKQKVMSQGMAAKADQRKMSMVGQAEKILNQPQFTLSNQNLPVLAALLRQAGASSIAKALEEDAKKWTSYNRTYKTNQDLLDDIAAFKGGLLSTEQKKDEETKDDETPPTSDDSPEGGETMDYEYDAQGNRVEKPPEKK